MSQLSALLDALDEDLLTQHVDELEQEAERKGGVLQTLADHFGKVYKATMPLAA